MHNKTKIFSLALLLLCAVGMAKADTRPYLCELGLQAGCGYYAGDANPHIFVDVREAYGAHFRYKFTQRWAVQVKGLTQRITGYDYTMRNERLDTKWEDQLINIDMMGEFNFFRFGTSNEFNRNIRPYTPYIFLGVGMSLYGTDSHNKPTFSHAAFYIPMGIGFKWKFAEFCGLNIAWQHNIYVADDLESRKSLDNRYNMNGSNIMNCDITGQLTAGIVFEFGHAPKPCRICNAEDGY